MQKIAKIVLALFVAAVGISELSAQSARPLEMQREISERETPLIFLGISNALKAYVGVWRGTQNIFEPTKFNGQIAEFDVEQSYSAESETSLVCSVKIWDSRGRSNSSLSKIEIVDGELLLFEISKFGKNPLYRGTVQGNTVKWFPYRLFFLLNIQEDKFFLKEREVLMYSDALQYVRNDKKKYEGLLATSAVFKKVEKKADVKFAEPKKLNPLLDRNFFKKKD